MKQFGQSVGHLLEKHTPHHTNRSDEGYAEANLSEHYLQELGLPLGSEAELFNIRPPPDTNNLRPMQLDKRKADTIRFKQFFKISGTLECFLIRACTHRAKVGTKAKKNQTTSNKTAFQ